MSQPQSLAPLALGTEEAGQMTGHTRSAIYRAISDGQLKSFKSGKRRLILVTELQNWINRVAQENSR